MNWKTPLSFAIGWIIGTVLMALLDPQQGIDRADVIVIMSCVAISLWLHHREHGDRNV